jgi:NAD(P)-dependent dehydrogenase (short-subunit alcohol dehydrogenase family)
VRDCSVEGVYVRLHDKVCLISGATSGIGEATARVFAEEGARLALTGRSEERGCRIVERCQGLGCSEVCFIPGDVSNPQDVARVVEETERHYGRIDVLFNNAGIIDTGAVDQIPIENFTRVIEVNVFGEFYFAHYVIPIMRRQKSGVIVNMASDWALVAGREAVAYCTSKGAILMMSKCIALDHAAEGIRCNAICPGDTLTPMHDIRAEFDDHTADEQEDFYSDNLPMGRMGRPEEVARAVLFLACDDSSFVTGIGMPVDGGNTCQ